MNIEAKFIKHEFKSQSTVCIKNECDVRDIFIGNININENVNIKSEINRVLEGTTKKEESDDMWKTNITEENILPIVKEEIGSDKEEGLLKIKTEELMLKSENESDDSENWAHSMNYMEGYKKFKHGKSMAEQYKCNLCNFTTHRISNLNRHIKYKHDSVKKYDCSFCDYSAQRKRRITEHILLKHDCHSVKKHGCELCDYKTHLKSDLKRHIIARHDRYSIKKHGCDICDYKTYRHSDLKKHILNRHDTDCIVDNIQIDGRLNSSRQILFLVILPITYVAT